MELPRCLQRVSALEQLEKMQNVLARERPIRRGSTAEVQVPSRRETSQDVEPVIALV